MDTRRLGQSDTHLRFAKDDVSVGGGRLKDVRFVDDEENVFGFSDGDAIYAEDRLQTQLTHRLPRLLLGS